MVLEADPEHVLCEAEEKGGKFAAVVKIVRKPGITGTVARTGYTYADDEEAADAAAEIVAQIVDESVAPEAELAEEGETEPETEETEPTVEEKEDGEGNG